MYRERRLQRNSAVFFVWRFDNMTATLLRSWNLCSVFRPRGFRKDNILYVNHTDACSWKYATCLDGHLNCTTWLILRFFLRPRTGPASIAYGPPIVELKQFCCSIIPNFSFKMSDVSEHNDNEFYYPDDLSDMELLSKANLLRKRRKAVMLPNLQTKRTAEFLCNRRSRYIITLL